ncbi:immunoglobulin superfamily containing leucine-rich repeat protein-like [Rhinophrynus dorsalis]
MIMGISFICLCAMWCLCLVPSSSCPASCRCVTSSARPSADCSYRELSFVPTDLPFNLSQLSLSANHISALNTTSFTNILGVTSLWLAYNQIVTIAPGTFKSLTRLMSLDISHNQLLDFPWSDLSFLHDLQILNLNNNQLETLPLGTFNNSKMLRSLQLSNNHLSTLAEGTFDHLSSLSHLQLHSNHFNCSCSLIWLQDWLKKSRATIDRRKDITCTSPKELTGVSLDEMPDLQCRRPLEMQNDDSLVGKTMLLCRETGVPNMKVHKDIQKSRDYKEIEVSIKVYANGSISVTPIEKDTLYLCHTTNHTAGSPKEVSISLTHPMGSGWLQVHGEKLLLMLVNGRKYSEENAVSCPLVMPILYLLPLLLVWWQTTTSVALNSS